MFACLYQMPNEFDFERLRDACQRLFDELGSMYVLAWEDLDEWLDEFSSEFVTEGKTHDCDSFVLREREIARNLSPDETTVYTVRDAGLFSQFVLVAMRHSEYGAIFVPLSATRSEIVRLLRFGDYFTYERCKEMPVQGKWLLGVGIAHISEEEDSVLFVCDNESTDRKVDGILRRIATGCHRDL